MANLARALSTHLGILTLAASLFALHAAQARADVSLIVRDSASGARTESQRLLIAPGKIRIDRPSAPSSVLLYDQVENHFVALDPSRQTFLLLDPVAADSMVSRAAQARVEAMTRLRERMSSMSPDERERMEKMIQRMEQSGVDATLPIRYRVRAKRSKVAGFSCQWIDAVRGGRRVRQICLADWRKLGLSNQDRGTLKAMLASLASIAEQVGNTAMFQDDMADGFPIHVKHYDERGRLTGEQILDSVATERLDPTWFEIPEGFEPRERAGLR